MFQLRVCPTEECAVVEINALRRACHLVPKFGNTRVDRRLTPNTVLDAYKTVFINNRVDKDAYRSIGWFAADGEGDEEAEEPEPDDENGGNRSEAGSEQMHLDNDL